MNEEIKNIEFKYSSVNDVRFCLITTFVGVAFLNVGTLPVYIPGPPAEGIVSLLIWSNLVFIVSSIFYFYLTLPIKRIRFFASREIIQFDLQAKPYLKIYWKDIETIEIVKVESYGKKINFLLSNSVKTVRLFLLYLTKKNKKIIVKTLKQFARELNVKYIERNEEKDDLEERDKQNLEIKRLIGARVY